MPHMVIFRNTEGKSGNHMTESLEDAVRFVEHLRNNEQVTDARVFRMQEVQLEFKVLYKVEISDDGPGSAESSPTVSASITSPVTASDPSPPPAARPPASEAEPEPTAVAAAPPAADGSPSGSDDQTGGRFGLFSRS